MSGRDMGASVRQRLLNLSRAHERPFQELLQYFAMERFLYRLAQSPFSDRFVLKGALLLTAWRAPLSRPTMDTPRTGPFRPDCALRISGPPSIPFPNGPDPPEQQSLGSRAERWRSQSQLDRSILRLSQEGLGQVSATALQLS